MFVVLVCELRLPVAFTDSSSALPYNAGVKEVWVLQLQFPKCIIVFDCVVVASMVVYPQSIYCSFQQIIAPYGAGGKLCGHIVLL